MDRCPVIQRFTVVHERFLVPQVSPPNRGMILPGKEHVSNVNWQKVIGNFRSGYQSIAPFEILLIELVANSLDAGAERISIDLEGQRPLHVVVIDDGRGMKSRREFEEYHDLGSLTKTRGGGIGWAGIGAKLYIDRCDSIYTETRSFTYSGASSWSFPEHAKAPIWKDVDSRGLIGGKRGTAIEITVSDPKEISRFTEENVTETILANYNYALKPHGDGVITLNGNRVEPYNPNEHSEKGQLIDVQLREGGRARGIICLLREDAPPGFALISIVVHGKTIGEQYDFRQFTRLKEPGRISGYVRCDPLIQVTTTSKDAFNRRSSPWKDFDKRVGKVFSSWLVQEGALEKIKADLELQRMAEDIQKDLNEVFSRPEIRTLGLDLFQNLQRRLTPIVSLDGESKGSIVEGTQSTEGTLGGLGTGGGVETLGDDPGKGTSKDPDGKVVTTERERRVRGGIRLVFAPFADKLERAWVDPGLQAIVVNDAHQAFRCAEELDAVAFYAIDCCFAVVTEAIEDEPKRDEVLSKLFGAYASLSG